MTRIVITRRALRDLADIDAYSVQSFGQQIADEYMADIDRALSLIAETPRLLRPRPEFSKHLSFYRVRRHLLVCDATDEAIHILTVIHSSMNLPDRIAELEPDLAREVELMRRRWRSK
jgi:plasmid stabilization system protein ParE